MFTAILILLTSVVLILLWLVIQSQKKVIDPTVGMLQQEVQSLRGQLTEAMLKSQETVNQQLGQISVQVNSQLNQVTQQLQKSTGDLNTRLDNAARVVQDVSKGLGSLSRGHEKGVRRGERHCKLAGDPAVAKTSRRAGGVVPR